MSELTLQVARKIDPRKVGIALFAIWSIFGLFTLVVDRGYAAWTLQTVDFEPSDLGLQVSSNATITAVLMMCAAGMAFALGGVDRSRRKRSWRLAGWALLALGVEELLGVHPWLQSKGASWGLSYLPLLVPAAVALALALRNLGSQPRLRALFGAAILLWLAAAVVDNPTQVGSETGAQALAMASAILFALAMLARHRYLANQYYPFDEDRLSVDQIASEVLSRISIRKLAIALAAITILEAVQYTLFHAPGYPHCAAVLNPCHSRDAADVGILDLNNEQTLAATFQASLLLATGCLALVISRLRATRAEMRRWWLTLGIVMLILSTDQIIAVHSRFGDSTGLPGQIILTPVAIAGIIAWFKVLRELWGNRLARTLLIVGAVLWFLSQASDVLLDPIESLSWTTTPEETVEATGSGLWLFSVLVWLRSKLPGELILPEPVAAELEELPIIEQLPAPGEGVQTPTG
jgi:hypothetical protein